MTRSSRQALAANEHFFVARPLRAPSSLRSDQVIEGVLKKSISQIFEDDGAEGFREAETSVLNEARRSAPCISHRPPGPTYLKKELSTEASPPLWAQVSSYARFVVSTGGGIVTTKANWGHLHNGVIVYLETPIECAPAAAAAAPPHCPLHAPPQSHAGSPPCLAATCIAEGWRGVRGSGECGGEG